MESKEYPTYDGREIEIGAGNPLGNRVEMPNRLKPKKGELVWILTLPWIWNVGTGVREQRVIVADCGSTPYWPSRREALRAMGRLGLGKASVVRLERGRLTAPVPWTNALTFDAVKGEMGNG